MANIIRISGGGSGYSAYRDVVDYFTTTIKTSSTAGDTCVSNSTRSCSRASSAPAAWMDLKSFDSYHGWACFSRTSAGCELTATSTSYGSSKYDTFTTTDGKTLYCGIQSSAWPVGKGSVVVTVNGTSKTLTTTGTGTSTFTSIDQDLIDMLYEMLG